MACCDKLCQFLGQNFLANRNNSNYNGFTSDLYNGNIKAMVTALPDKTDYQNSYLVTPKSQIMVYAYDQLNRIKQSQSIELNVSTNDWGNTVSNPAFQSDYTYDANGNIQFLTRSESGVLMDQLIYEYAQSGINNKLHLVRDLVASSAFTNDIDNQYQMSNPYDPNVPSSWNYQYDEIGNLVSDVSEGITEIKWSVSGKITSIDWNGTKNLTFLYDPSGQRVMKKFTQGTTTATTWYIRDASGNVMSTYIEDESNLQWEEAYIYGSSRIGSYQPTLILGQTTGNNDPVQLIECFRGKTTYELSNHLGNVLAVITDRKIGSRASGTGNWEYFEVDYQSFTDYYPFGMPMAGRCYSLNTYRWGFNGQERDDEIKGEGNSLDFGARVYDARLGQFFAIDPLFTRLPDLSPYIFVGNSPIKFIDQNGEILIPYDEKSREVLCGHFKTMFKVNEKKILGITIRKANDRMGVLLSSHIGQEFDPIPLKEFRKAARGLSKDQRALARGYLNVINSIDKTLVFASLDQNAAIPNDLFRGTNLQTEIARYSTVGQALTNYGGGATGISDQTGGAILVSHNFNLPKSTVDDDREDNPTGQPSFDDAIDHEIVGHGVAEVIANYSNSSLSAIQVSNITRRILNINGMRNGADHKIGNSSGTNSIPDFLKKDPKLGDYNETTH